MTKSIYYLAPYLEMLTLASDVLSYINHLEIITGHLSQGVKEAVELEYQNKVEVFITRGGTTSFLLKAGIRSPIVEIPVTVYDLMRAVKEASQIDNRIGVIGFPDMVRGIKNLEPIMKVKLEVFIIEREEVIEDMLDLVTRLKINVLVGGVLCCKAANRRGIPSILIKTGKEAILKAGEEAQRIAEIKRKEEAKNSEIQAILECANEGIITVNNKEIITICNPAAEKIASGKSIDIVGKHVKSFISGDTLSQVLRSRTMVLGDLQIINKAQVLTNNVPLMVNDGIVGAVTTFQDVTKIQEYEEKIRRNLRSKEHVTKFNFDDIIGSSKVIKEAKKKAASYSQVDSSLMILGETGTGKEMFAQAIHNGSSRRDKPFVAINCAAVPATLLESELFGYEEGSFTDAKKGGKRGLFTLAHQGTIFLDEVSEISPALQTRLLRVLQEKEVRPVGGTKVIPIDIRIISASNKNLKKAIKEGVFRNDLFYRLNVLNIRIPPLRERKSDILQLIIHFIEKDRKDKNKEWIFSNEALNYLSAYEWPGNIRELENIVERLVLIIEEASVEINLDVVKKVMTEEDFQSPTKGTGKHLKLEGSLKDMEKQIIINYLDMAKGNQTQTAEKLNISRTHIWRILKDKTREVQEHDL